MQTSMKAVEITSPGGPEVLEIATRPVPTPAAGEVLIEVAAAGINRPDMLQRQGHYNPPPGASDLPGLEVAGRVVAVADDVDTVQVGDLVCALVAGGAVPARPGRAVAGRGRRVAGDVLHGLDQHRRRRRTAGG